MRSTLLLLLGLAAVALASVGARAQSLPRATNGGKPADPFPRMHESLDVTVDGLVAAASSDRSAVSTQTEREAEAGLRVATETGRGLSAPVAPLTPAMARLEQLRPMLDSILRSEGVPLDLAFVVVVESGGKPDALSPKGARGLWQLMPETARRYGLVIDGDRDDRLDVEKSTRAAAQYLRDLHAQFGSWPTALAAYNAGEQAVQRAIERGQSAEFGVLSSRELLPLETRMYVPAVVNLMVGSGSLSKVVGRTTQLSREERIVYAVGRKIRNLSEFPKGSKEGKSVHFFR